MTDKVLDRETAGWHNITILAMEAGEPGWETRTDPAESSPSPQYRKRGHRRGGGQVLVCPLDAHEGPTCHFGKWLSISSLKTDFKKRVFNKHERIRSRKVEPGSSAHEGQVKRGSLCAA